jgi:putative transposase
LDFLNHHEKAALVERDGSVLSVSRQAELLGISRSGLYYTPTVNAEDIRIRHAIDEIFTKYPFFGSRRIRIGLQDSEIFIGREQVRHHMQAMGLEAIYPKKKKNTSISDNSHRKYPYLLANLPIVRPDQVWGTDITYIRLENGFCYLVALLDWYSRYVVAWKLSETLEIDFCLENLTEALQHGVPEIHNSDQGSHFTSPQYTDLLTAQNIQISMDGRGRCMDNIFTERLWRTIKYEDIYLKDYRTFAEALAGIAAYLRWYNHERKHSALDYHTPASVYQGLTAQPIMIQSNNPAPILSTLSTITV